TPSWRAATASSSRPTASTAASRRYTPPPTARTIARQPDRTGRPSSDAQEDPPPVHPEAEQPQDQQHARRGDHRPVVAGEPARSEVDAQATADPRLQELAHAVHGDGVHADDHQGERPAAVA